MFFFWSNICVPGVVSETKRKRRGNGGEKLVSPDHVTIGFDAKCVSSLLFFVCLILFSYVVVPRNDGK